jgi:pyridoxal biosynthesis lyase PdxS
MADQTPPTSRSTGTYAVKRGLAEMLKGGVIMDVVNADQAKIAEDAGATAVMALERVPADIRRDGGVARMSDPEMIEAIKEAVTIPVMAKARIGHFVEAQILEALGVDYVDESEVLTPADSAELFDWAKRLQAPLPLVQEIAELGWLPVPLFCAGGIATPADAALVMQLGAEAVFVGSGIFKSDNPAPRAKAIVEATTHFRDAHILAKVSRALGAPMTGIAMDELDVHLAERGW